MNKARLVSLGAVHTHTHTHTSRSLEKENKEINRIKIDNKITIKPKNVKKLGFLLLSFFSCF